MPNLRAFHGLLGVDERDLLIATRATFKLATRFRDWSTIGQTFLHPFGPYGIDIKHELFQAYWLARRQEGHPSPLEEWSVTGLAASPGSVWLRGRKTTHPPCGISRTGTTWTRRFMRAFCGRMRRSEAYAASRLSSRT